MKRQFIHDMLDKLASLDWMTPKIMFTVTLAFIDSVQGGENSWRFDYIDFLKQLREYDLPWFNWDGLIDIILTFEEE